MLNNLEIKLYNEEAIERFKILGLSSETITKCKKKMMPCFCNVDGSIHESTDEENGDDQDWNHLMAVGEFNEYKKGIAYMLNDDKGTISVFYMSYYIKDWEKEREMLKQGVAQAYVYTPGIIHIQKFPKLKLKKFGEGIVIEKNKRVC